MKFDPVLMSRHQLDILAALYPRGIKLSLVGSMSIDQEGNDYDYVVLVPDGALRSSVADLEAHGFKLGCPTEGGSGSEDGWLALRKGKANVMLTDDEQFYFEFITSTRVCQYVTHLFAATAEKAYLSREERIKIHRIIMNGEEP